MDPWFNHLIYFFGSGLAFFLGAAMIGLGMVLSLACKSGGWLAVRNLVVIVGIILVAVSATPIPFWLYGLWGAVTLIWLVLEWIGKKAGKKLMAGRILVGFLLLIVPAMELPYHLVPSVPSLDHPVLYVIGDSVSAGMGGKSVTWPRLLAKQHGVVVHDFSQMGATVRSARKQAAQMQGRPGLVLLEIGGNDLLGRTPAAEFREDLARLFEDVCRPGRTTIMFELPLPPFTNDFGCIQRDLARSHDVILIPKRVFLQVLTADDATLDGIHLSLDGHQLMADTVWDLVKGAY